MMRLVYFMRYSFMFGGRMNRDLMMSRSMWNIFMYRNNFMLLNYWMFHSLFVFRGFVMLWWSVMVSSCRCFGM